MTFPEKLNLNVTTSDPTYIFNVLGLSNFPEMGISKFIRCNA